MTVSSKAVFLSYASQDGGTALQICEALRSAGIEVWFDQSELRGGEVWDATIRHQIKTCALFIALVSEATRTRGEGYFRLEWKLAIDRSHLMSTDMPFLIPVAVDAFDAADRRIPDRFREVQWLQLRSGTLPPESVGRIQSLLGQLGAQETPGEREDAADLGHGARRGSGVEVSRDRRRARRWTISLSAVLFAAMGAWALHRWAGNAGLRPATGTSENSISPNSPLSPPPTAPAAPVAFSPPPRSIAVLPFANMSGDPKQEYFSDGISEELLDALSRLTELHVVARTSSFSFRGKSASIATIAQQLNVATVLEGSVRKSGAKVRIAVELIDAVSGYRLWSQAYDRGLNDILKVQQEVAEAVARQLKITLDGTRKALTLGGTDNIQAHDAYLSGVHLYNEAWSKETTEIPRLRDAIANFDRAIGLDPDYAEVYAKRSQVRTLLIYSEHDVTAVPRQIDQARVDAEKAVSLAPEDGMMHLALAEIFALVQIDLSRAAEEYERAISLSPGSARVNASYARFASQLGRGDTGIAYARRAVALDPENATRYYSLGTILTDAGHFDEALQALKIAQRLDPSATYIESYITSALLAAGRYQAAITRCETRVPFITEDIARYCLAFAYHAVGRLSDAQRMLDQIITSDGDAGASALAGIYAQWGDKPAALRWLLKAESLHDPGLQSLRSSWIYAPIREEPEFRALESRLHYPPR